MKPKLLIVGAFPPKDTKIFGGVITTCQTLLDSDFPSQFDLLLIDSTQISNPPPAVAIRLFLAIRRFFSYLVILLFQYPDAVLLFASPGTSLLEKGVMAWIARAKRIPVLLFPRGGKLIDLVHRSPFQKLWVKITMRGATHILCQGSAWQRFAIDVLGFKESHTPIIHNWSATSELLQIGSQRTSSSPSLTLHMLFLGWLEEEKGVFELLEACRELAHHHAFELTIAGRGHAEQRARDFVSNNGLENHVHFVGWVQGAEKKALLETADILVLPSWAEGFPNAIIEAMAARVAVIVTAVGNVPDLLRSREEALIVPPKDSTALRVAIEELLIHSDLRWQLAEKGHLFARETFSVETGVTRLTEFIKEAISS